MSIYRRFITYMYESLDSSKSKNCGFVKIEVRNQRITMFFQLKNAPCQDICNVYLCRRGIEPEYLFFHSLPIKNGNVCYKLESLHQLSSNEAFSFSQCCGILCTDEKGNICSTCWDKGGTLPSFDSMKMTSQAEESDSAPQEPETPPEPKPVIVQPPASLPIQEPTPTPPKTFPELWSHLQKEFSSLDPFEDDAIVETIKITPSDLGYLQTQIPHLGLNQFLLHGYKCYHHLILGRLHGQNQYILGIPGVYDPQEQFMAKMFGFPCFKPIRESRQKNGQFGYWLKCFH